MTTKAVRCECGEATGEQCQHLRPAREMVVIEWMPEHLRASHEAAGNWGCWPANGAVRLRVSRDCADWLRWGTDRPTEAQQYADDPAWAILIDED